jgi:hypothetical protein
MAFVAARQATMHRALAAWLDERPWHAGVACAICGLLAPQMPVPFLILAGAIPVLIALTKDGRLAMLLAAVVATASASVILPLPDPATWTLIGIVAIVFSASALATVWRRTGSPNLCFQVAVLVTAMALAIIHLVLADPSAVWVERLTELMRSMAEAGLNVQGDVKGLVQVWAQTMWGALAAMTLAAILASLFLGRWWSTLLQQQPGQFGAEYRQLRLGRVLGLGVTILFILAMSLDSPMIDSLAWVGLAGLSFQGLAAAHRGKAVGRLNRGWLAAIYVLLLMPLSTSITVFVLAIWGFTDNWLRPRATS